MISIGAFLTTLMLASPAHDFHVSVCQGQLRDGQLQMTIKLFTDDLETALEQRMDEKLRLGTPDEHPRADSLLRDYLFNNFAIKSSSIGEKPVFVGKEVELELCYLYWEYSVSEPLSRLEIRNTLLFELFDDQRNLVHIETGEQIHSLFLSSSQPSQEIQL